MEEAWIAPDILDRRDLPGSQSQEEAVGELSACALWRRPPYRQVSGLGAIPTPLMATSPGWLERLVWTQPTAKSMWSINRLTKIMIVKSILVYKGILFQDIDITELGLHIKVTSQV